MEHKVTVSTLTVQCQYSDKGHCSDQQLNLNYPPNFRGALGREIVSYSVNKLLSIKFYKHVGTYEFIKENIGNHRHT